MSVCCVREARSLKNEEGSSTCADVCSSLRSCGYEWYYLYIKYSDLSKQATTLICLTGAVASRIFAALQEGAYDVFSFGYHSLGVSYLNSGVRSLFASIRDLNNARDKQDLEGMVLTALKIFVKSINIILAIAALAGLIAGWIGFPQVLLAIAPFITIAAEITWLTSIFNEFSDYYQNSRLEIELLSIREKIKFVGSQNNQDQRIQLTVRAFIELVQPECELPALPKELEKKYKKRQNLALRLVRHLDEVTLMTFQRALKNIPKDESLCGLNEEVTSRCFNVFEREISVKRQNFIRQVGYAFVTTPLLELSKIAFQGILELPLRWSMSLIATAVAVDTIFSHNRVGGYLEGSIDSL